MEGPSLLIQLLACRAGPSLRSGRRDSMQRLYLQFYLTILVVLAVFVGAAALLWWLAEDDARTPQYLDVAAELTGALLPDADAPVAEQQKAHRGAASQAALRPRPLPARRRHDRHGRPAAAALRSAARARTGWRRGPGGPNFTLQLPDGRWLVARQVRERPSPTFWITAFLALVALAVAVGAYPVVRGLGRRLERLKAGVEQLRRRSRRARQGRGPRRGGGAGRKASTAPPSASRSWSPPTACCSPIAATSCARRSPASPSPPRCWATAPTPRRASR